VPHRDPEKLKAWRKEHYLKNKERIKERNAANQKAKREYYNAYMRAYRAKNGRKDRPTKTIEEKLAACKPLQRWLEKPKLSPSVAELVLMEQERLLLEAKRHMHRLLYNREKSKRRKAQIRANMVKQVSVKALQTRFAAFDNCCAYCGAKPDYKLIEIEHFYPICSGGAHDLSNIVPACHACNRSKFSHDPFEWFRAQNFYKPESEAKILRILGIEQKIRQLSFL
jgi:5-methylcytosine-specific restriction endonuclease McrA|tara:strand:+ start:166 stop:840 length:675 start_codon:yes stop_codon:yes gene_type:complete